MDLRAQELLTFWREAGPKRWFAKDDAFDAALRSRYLGLHDDAAAGELPEWEETAPTMLALLLLLDQVPRNIFRGDARAFETDVLALDLARAGIARGFDQATDKDLRAFFYLPLMHSEVLADQEFCVALCEKLGNPDNLKFAILHRDIIARFGRFPHRNDLLGRETTAQEQAFLDSGGFAG